ncbi:MAG: 1,4-dihydroxy-6-naphthoate synthase [Acidobacteria bacterium]|nr:1,4-dihydroxy-6-naphthoate synthase [Acidobacteriota bacterium]MCB9398209.1 1,4-dihydroxy-6-naphthoate synthase [Acidobacteriota bacterium]
MNPIQLAISPCPNDTFIFGALIQGWVPAPSPFELHFGDIEVLNEWAWHGSMDICKISIRALAGLADYQLLDSGAALGFGCGPLVVTQADQSGLDWGKVPIAVPGKRTTASLLLRKWLIQQQGVPAQDVENGWHFIRFDHILEGVQRGEFKVGLIIHESRFTYQQFGLHKLVDLGAWWEQTTGLPIPLGGIVGRKTLGSDLLEAWQEAIAASVRFAWAQPEKLRPFMREHATEMADEVMDQHVGLYVNSFSESLGSQGHRAISFLLDQVGS